MKIYIVTKNIGGKDQPMWAYDSAEEALKSARQDSLDNTVMDVVEVNFYPTKLREFLS